MNDSGLTGTGGDSGNQLGAIEQELTKLETDSALSVSDWRVLVEQKAALKPRKPRVQGPKLHLSAHPASPDVERTRARDIVDYARSEVEAMFSAARDGTPPVLMALQPLIDAISASMERDPRAMLDVTRLKQAGDYTVLHAIAVCALMIGLARQAGEHAGGIRAAAYAGLLHDIGMGAVSAELLDRPGALSPEEFEQVMAHTALGHAMLADCQHLPDRVRQAVLHHHERIDGTGYPARIPAADLDPIVRMVTVCDVYDAMTSERPYRRGMTPGQAIAWMRQSRGQFDHAILNALVRLQGAFPPGTLVRLRSELLGVVIDEPRDDSMNPPVVAFHCAMTDRPVAWRRLETRLDPIIAVEQPDQWRFRQWESQCTAMLTAAANDLR